MYLMSLYEGYTEKNFDYIVSLNLELKVKINLRNFSGNTPVYNAQLSVDDLNMNIKV